MSKHAPWKILPLYFFLVSGVWTHIHMHPEYFLGSQVWDLNHPIGSCLNLHTINFYSDRISLCCSGQPEPVIFLTWFPKLLRLQVHAPSFSLSPFPLDRDSNTGLHMVPVCRVQCLGSMLQQG